MPLRPKHSACLVLSCIAASLFLIPITIGAAEAKQRLAFVVGVSNYDKSSGLTALKSPENDAKEVKAALQGLRDRFEVEIVTNEEAKSKEAFQAAFDRFLSRIRPGDEVLFYFSGHGYSVPEKNNYYLLPSAKSQPAYLTGLPASELRSLDTADKKAKNYREWIAGVAISEDEIEKSIAERSPAVIILVADACRNFVTGTKGAALEDGGVVLPSHTSFGTFRLYSASAGQASLDSLEPITRVEAKPSPGKSSKEITNSLFTKVFLSQIDKPGLEISVMAAQVRMIVRNQARKTGSDQIPDFSQDDRSTDFYFSASESGSELAALCITAEAELAQLRLGIASGSLGREAIERKAADLSRCGSSIREELQSLIRIEAQGTGSFATQMGQTLDVTDLTDPQQICDVKGSSSLDPDRPQGLAGTEIQKTAIAGLAGEIDRAKAEADITAVVEACEQAVNLRPRIARYKFNAARGNYALATMRAGLDRTVALRKASSYNAQAVDLGYPAAYNNLALMIQNGEYYKENADLPEPADREKAAALLMRGADLNHVVAQYNLGMAYLNGGLGLRTGSGTSGAAAEQTRGALAFRHLSAAAERTYVPAMVETAKLLHDGNGVLENPKRAVELLEIAASRGSWEAMYWLGFAYRSGKMHDMQRAIVWYARAAEAGEVRSQEALAEMLTNGDGLPAPQREAAGRYWRLAAYAGSSAAQTTLGNLLRDGKIPFRPLADRKPDGGALEVRTLYLAAFEKGDPRAGLALAQLYRNGFPKETGSDAIPKNPEEAVDLLYKTISRVKQAEPDSSEADPITEARAAFELVNIYDKGEAKRRDGTPVINEDQIQQLRQDYGDGGNSGYIRASAIGPIACGSERMDNVWLMVWDWDRDIPPTEPQLRWLERRLKCREAEIARAKEDGKKEPKPESIGFTKAFKDRIAKEYKVAREEKKKGTATAKSFYDRMAAAVSKSNERRSK